MSQPYTPTPRTRLVREAERAVYDREAAYRILDEGFLCHVGFVADGQPFVIPTSYGRKDANLYIHGSAASRMSASRLPCLMGWCWRAPSSITP
jgi:uncharacterized protein